MQAKVRFFPFQKSRVVDEEFLSPMVPVLKSLTVTCQAFFKGISE